MRHVVKPVIAFAVAGLLSAATVDTRSTIAERVMRLTRDSSWTRVASVPVGFDTHHPQGMVKIGDTFYVSSVEITERTKPFRQPVGG